MVRPAAELFFRHVRKTATCWLWTAAKRGKYGCFRFKGKSAFGAHRAAYLLFVGDIPEDIRVLHRCDTPLCVNPEHLFLGTAKDNTHDALAKGRLFVGERHPGAKLTQAKVAALRARHAEGGVTEAMLGAEFGISAAQAGNIVRKAQWK